MFLQKEKFEKKINFIVSSSYFILIIASIFFVIKYILPFLMPFLIGFSIAFILQPISSKISTKTKLNNKFCSIAIVILTYFFFIFLIWLVGLKIISALKTISMSSNEIYNEYILPMIEYFKQKAIKLLKMVKPSSEINSFATNELTDYLNDFIASCSKYILTTLAKITTNIPEFLVELTFAIISSIYFSYDYYKITNFIKNLFPKNLQQGLLKTKWFAIKTIIKYIKSYVYLMLISFVFMTIGFFIIKLKNPIGTAAIISAFDAIPLIGSGIIILPWALALFISDKVNMAIGLLIIFLVVNILRSFLEPKILGATLGMHPLATLISIYVGIKFLGFLGMVAAPIVANIFFNLFKDEILKNEHNNLN